MRRLAGIVLLLAGCTSSGRQLAGTSTTVPQPGVPDTLQTAAASGARRSFADPPNPPASEPARNPAGSNRVARWFRSGRGWTWGAASRGPTRDLALDRLMVDTLTSAEPTHSREPTGSIGRVTKELWVYPDASPRDGAPRATAPIDDVDPDPQDVSARYGSALEAARRYDDVPRRDREAPTREAARSAPDPPRSRSGWRTPSRQDEDYAPETR